MTIRAGWSTPLLHVADVERSLRFYSLLGFQTVDVEFNDDILIWARSHCEGGAVMFLRTDEDEREPSRDVHDRILLYLYTEDLPAFRSQLIATGIDTGSINYPPYMPSGEICLSDPDGYVVLIGHWSDREHEAWEARRKLKKDSGLIP